MNRPRRLEHEAVLGVGAELFDRASRALINWDLHRRAGLVVVADGPAAPRRAVTLRPRTGPGAWLRIEAESAHATWLAKLGAPVARAEQNRLTRRYLGALREQTPFPISRTACPRPV